MRDQGRCRLLKSPSRSRIYYVQRRDSHRVSLVGQPTRFEGRWERRDAAAAVTGTVGDLSAEGVGLLLDGELPLRQGDRPLPLQDPAAAGRRREL